MAGEPEVTEVDLKLLAEIAAAREAEQPRCKNCGWYARTSDQSGECHRFPPVVPPPGLTDDPWRHAVTPANSVCGEFNHAKTGDGFLSRLQPEKVQALLRQIDDRLSRVERSVR